MASELVLATTEVTTAILCRCRRGRGRFVRRWVGRRSNNWGHGIQQTVGNRKGCSRKKRGRPRLSVVKKEERVHHQKTHALKHRPYRNGTRRHGTSLTEKLADADWAEKKRPVRHSKKGGAGKRKMRDRWVVRHVSSNVNRARWGVASAWDKTEDAQGFPDRKSRGEKKKGPRGGTH